VQAAARAIGVEPLILNVGSERNIDAAFASAANSVSTPSSSALIIFVSRSDQLSGWQRVMGSRIYFCASCRHWWTGGYGPSQTDAIASPVATRADSEGREPADLPVVQSIKFELVVNLKTPRHSA